MRYICIDQEALTLSIEDSRRTKQRSIPTELESVFRCLSPLEHVLYYGVLYPLYEAEYFRTHPEEKGRVAFKLAEPDPWLVAIAWVMWEGIVQGITWDSIKLLVDRALHVLSDAGLAPSKNPMAKSGKTNEKMRARSRSKARRKAEIGFHWQEYVYCFREVRQLTD